MGVRAARSVGVAVRWSNGMAMRGSGRVTVRRGAGMDVRRTDAVHLVASRIVAVMSPAVAAGKTKKRHGSHAGASKNHAEKV